MRSKKYRKWVSGLPCAVTGYQGEVAPHHPKGRGFGGTVKCSDLFCIPLKHDIHMELHQIGWKSWEEKYRIHQLVIALKTIDRALEEGVLNES